MTTNEYAARVPHRIRLATHEDIGAALALSNRTAAEHPAANLATEPESLDSWLTAFEATRHAHPWLVAVDAERVIAFAKSSPHRSRGGYKWTVETSVYVASDALRRGIASELYERLIEMLRAQGYVLALAIIGLPNEASERAHARAGFTRCGVLHRAGYKLDRYCDVAYWELALQSEAFVPGVIRGVDEVA